MNILQSTANYNNHAFKEKKIQLITTKILE